MAFPADRNPYNIRVTSVTVSGSPVSGAAITLYNDTKSTSTVKTSNETNSNISINLSECGDWTVGDIIHVKAAYGGNEKVSGNHTTASGDNGKFEFGTLAIGAFPFNPYVMRVEKVTDAGADVASATLKFENVTKALYKELTGAATNSNGSYNLGDIGDWDDSDEIKVTATKATKDGSAAHTIAVASDHGRHDFGSIAITGVVTGCLDVADYKTESWTIAKGIQDALRIRRLWGSFLQQT